MYYLFLSTFRDPQWNVRILTRYEGKITSFLEANVPGHVKNAHEIQLRLEFGRLMAIITVGDREFQFNVCSMIESSQ
ncbi:hypothetical protein SAMN05216327_12718 [Dyadobacter sp. SG02]|nr:hypothetical protein SAMN05216327_12718 [Dyadobacter sp. SG02]